LDDEFKEDGWAGCVARMGEKYVGIRFWWEYLRERDHLEDPGVGGRIILNSNLNKRVLNVSIGFICLRSTALVITVMILQVP
jgi:hypothetical protein